MAALASSDPTEPGGNRVDIHNTYWSGARLKKLRQKFISTGPRDCFIVVLCENQQGNGQWILAPVPN